MEINESFYKDPNFKKKLFAVDDIICSSSSDSNRPMPSSDKLRLLDEFRFGTGPIARYESGIDCDEVFPNIIVGNAAAARSKNYLKAIGVTHVLNCAQGNKFNMVSTDAEYYADVGIKFKGLPLDDIWMEDISRYFYECADFIDDAVSKGGNVFIHCMVGVSRSATIAIAYIMLRHGKSVEDAVRRVRNNRRIRPNEGFLKQLVQFDLKLNQQS